LHYSKVNYSIIIIIVVVVVVVHTGLWVAMGYVNRWTQLTLLQVADDSE